MALVVGYDRHPASRAAVLFAGELAERRLNTERQHVGEALDAVHVQWTHRVLHGDPVTTLLKAADECAATLIVVGRPQHGLGPVLSHVVTGTVTRNLLRHSTRPVAVVPEFGDNA